MSLVNTKTKHARKLSRFQKLWNQADNLKKENARFCQRLDQLVQRLRDEVLPAEREAASKLVPLLRRLLTLGQRKSMTQWQRHQLNEWILELIEPLMSAALIDQALDEEINRYQAFYFGIELDEQSGESAAEQIRKFYDQQEDAWDDEFARESEDERRARIEQEVEQELDHALGKAPDKPVQSDADFDLFGDELQAAKQQAYDNYQRQRAELREELMNAWMLEDEDDPFDDFDPFDLGEEPFEDAAIPKKKAANAMSNEVFTRLFRATAAVLHPDREQDEAKKELNHQRMSELLKARKQGDVMTVMDMYQAFVGNQSGLTDQEENQLINALTQQIEQLKQDKAEYCYSSPLHRVAFEQFYFNSAKKTENAVRQHLETARSQSNHAQELAVSITSVKTLKPYLEQRYEDSCADFPFDEMLEDLMMDDGPFGFRQR